jgi:hypothetical protein
MKEVIKRIYKRTTEYSYPSQATTTANALDLLSSGIYTEEERFVFELLQNAVDSFEPNAETELYIKIALTDDHLVFMHNGTPFTERDLEGLCDIGNGNKMNVAEKIGYKGIGFKSVFMHSQLVTVLTDGTCFKFDKGACENIVQEKGNDYAGVRMPWQIIPMITDVPSDVDTSGFNVVTYIQTDNRNSLRRKIEKLLADTRFLLFLKVDNLGISFFDGDEEIIKLSKSYKENVLVLLKNEVPQNRWLIHSKEVKLPPEVKIALSHDTKVPTKLKESESVEISFAIALDKNGCIVPLKDAVMYTYLPTSYSIGLSFVVNANFITDAGRQQIAKDCTWNEFIFSQIPGLYLNWIAEDVALHYSDWYKVLPHILESDDELSNAYSQALSEAIKSVPFVRTIDGRMVLVRNAICDHIDISSNVPLSVLNNFVHTEISEEVSVEYLVSQEIGRALAKYDIACVETKHATILLEKSDTYLVGLSAEEMLDFLTWLKRFSETQSKGFQESISYAKILVDENNCLVEPIVSFFPSEYSDENPDITEDAKIIKQELAELFDEDLSSWLRSVGVQEMSNISVIKSVICKNGYINQDNAVKVVQFIFDCEQKEDVLDALTSTEMGTIRLLTKNEVLESADTLFLDSAYGIYVNADNSLLNDYFVSSKYIRTNAEVESWQQFFKKIGVNTKIGVKYRKFGDDTPLYRWLSTYVDYCKSHEKNWGYSIHTGGLFVHIFIQAQLPPILNFVSDSLHSCRFIWSNVMAYPLQLDEKKDYIAGHTGWGHYAYGYFKDNIEGHRYLGELLLPHILRSKNILPGTDGRLHKSTELLAPTESNYQLCGCYLPTLDLDCKMHPDWHEIIDFKTQLDLTDYIEILSAISQDQDAIKENKDRINRIYEQMCDNWDFAPNSTEYAQLQEWGKTHKLLSKEGQFCAPSSLYLLSSHLSGVELSNQIYHGKHLESSRFTSMMAALGVCIITDHRVNGLENAIIDNDVTNMLLSKCAFLTSIAGNDTFTEESWDEIYAKMETAIRNLNFYKVDDIRICYGNQEFEKTVYSNDAKFYYVGKFGLANQELLHGAIMKAIDFPMKARTIFLTILQMNDFDELKEYIQQKGYDTSFIIEPHEIAAIDTPNNAVVMSGQDGEMGGLTTVEMRQALVEAKDVILNKLLCDGFDISQAEWDDWTCIDGVKKDGVEYPLVIRSNKSQRNTCLSPMDWNQLMKPNAMFAVVTNSGVGTISLREILKSREKISIQFSSENIEKTEHIKELSQVFAYFKGIQFNFDSYVHPVVNQWERFVAPEQSTGELPIAVSTNALPE